MENNTAKHFVLQLGSLASLYLSLSFLIVLLFGVINITLPDASDTTWQLNNAKQMVKIGIAMVIVFFPVYIALTRIVNCNRRNSDNHGYLGLTKWLIYLSLLIAGGVLLGDFVAVIMAYLDGDITSRFLLKAFALFVIIGSAFTYYFLDSKGYWMNREKQSKICALVAVVIVAVIVALGLINVDSPAEARELKIDNKQVSDLQQIQWSIQDYLSVNEELPQSLGDLQIVSLPTASTERTPYVYNLTEAGFELCATFAQPSQNEDIYSRPYPTAYDIDIKGIYNMDNWEHPAGYYCFERVVK